MAVEGRYDYRQATKSAKRGCVIFIIGLIPSCALFSWITWQSIKLDRFYVSFWICAPLVVFILFMFFGAFKFMMGAWEQDEIEARVMFFEPYLAYFKQKQEFENEKK